jgi:predicted ATPase
LRAIKQGASYRISSEDVDRYAARLEQHAVPEAVADHGELPAPDQFLSPLPVPPSSFVGREASQAALTALLLDPAARIVTLTGPGGVGKSRLSQATATSLARAFPDGVVYVALAAITDPDLVMPAIADALAIQEMADRDRDRQVIDFLREKRLLLLLDNFEQILDAAPVIARLAAAAAELKVLITSRAPLHITGEHELSVPPLDLAGEQATPDELMATDAGRLFVVRARQHQPSLVVDETTAPLIADICARLDDRRSARHAAAPPDDARRDRLELRPALA